MDVTFGNDQDHNQDQTSELVDSVRDLSAIHEAKQEPQEVTERERNAMALLDLVIQRLFGISASIASMSVETAPAISERLSNSVVLIDETIQLIRSVSGEVRSGRENRAGRQSELLGTSGPTR
jgi:signal transduction histidine kinase